MFAGLFKRSDGTPEPLGMGFLFLTITVLGGSYFIWIGMKLKAVRLEGHYLCVSNYLSTERIPLIEVASVRDWSWRGGLVVVRFNHDTKFGKSIRFFPRRRLMRFWPEPVAEELRTAVVAARHRAGSEITTLPQ
jgi:hypothetical protein